MTDCGDIKEREEPIDWRMLEEGIAEALQVRKSRKVKHKLLAAIEKRKSREKEKRDAEKKEAT